MEQLRETFVSWAKTAISATCCNPLIAYHLSGLVMAVPRIFWGSCANAISSALIVFVQCACAFRSLLMNRPCAAVGATKPRRISGQFLRMVFSAPSMSLSLLHNTACSKCPLNAPAIMSAAMFTSVFFSVRVIVG